MSTFVLCHGAWGGGWSWVRVAKILRDAGHDVFVPTYTGLGERTHLATPEVGLHTHIKDVRNVIKYERLEDFVLVGHSYGGMVITGVADQEWQKISRIVYLDAFLPNDGQSLNDLSGRDITPETLRNSEEKGGGGWRLPRPEGSLHPDLSDSDRAWIESLTSMQPVNTFTDKLSLSGNHLKIAEKIYVLCTTVKETPFYQFADWTRSQDDWKTVDLPTHHHLLQSMPEETAAIILGGV